MCYTQAVRDIWLNINWAQRAFLIAYIAFLLFIIVSGRFFGWSWQPWCLGSPAEMCG